MFIVKRLSMLFEFLKTTFQHNRSSLRTTKLHKVILDEILRVKPEWKKYTWVIEVKDPKFLGKWKKREMFDETAVNHGREYKIKQDGYGGTFDVDIAGFEGDELIDENLKVVALIKANNSCVGKNIKNFANTSVGEAARVFYAPNVKLEKLLFVSVLPRVSPIFKNDGNVKGFDNVITYKKRSDPSNILNAQYGNKVEVIDTYYDIGDVKLKKTKDEFNDIIVQNLDELVVNG